MNTQTAYKRLKSASLLNCKGKVKGIFQEEFLFLCRTYGGRKLHLIRWNISGHHRTLEIARHNRVINLLDALKLKYELGNDAPRGGMEGRYIYIPKTELRKLDNVNYDELL